MSGPEHRYAPQIVWTGDTGTGTSGYRAYERAHEISAGDKPVILGSADGAFRGDDARWNPEDLLVASVSTCHMLWYLHLCADAGVVVEQYRDSPVGRMVEDAAIGGYFTAVVLNPQVVIQAGGDADLALRLHHEAHAKCFVANSVKFPVTCEAIVSIAN